MAGPHPLLVLLLIVAAAVESGRATATPAGCAAPADSSSTLRVLHAFGPCSPFHSTSASWEDTVLDLLSSDDSRLLYLTSLKTARRSFVPIAPGRQLLQTPTYVVRARLGSPPQPLLLALDTSSDVAWLPCSGCSGCPSSSAAPPFDTSRSTTYRPVRCGAPPCSQVPNPSCPAGATACGFNLTYGSSSLLAGLAQDSLSLASDVVPGYTFGCIQKAAGPSVPPHGLLGLGRGPLSFLSQTKSLYASTFSYCLPSFKSLNFSGTLRLGPAGQPKTIKTTQLRSSPRRSSLYFVDLVGIRVGRKVVDIPPAAIAFDAATGAGTIFDSGTMFTRLVAPAYAALRDEFRRQVRGAGNATSLGGFDTCYQGSIAAPAITFMFAGMNMTLPADNYLIHSTAGSLTCLAMAAAPDNVNSVLNVIASMQQMNHRVLFDAASGRLGVARELCTV
ncbi:aspartyl protease AED3-like [Phoenix dactylifera]|uniref:Aspartyl protease AED3-like n=1 Tax=Phoenix dactylifera TaxID=42345 RepID=A0A8B7CP67_PHODC|nr:aspartyl protease AED3-like [Phoenix dactylifera]